MKSKSTATLFLIIPASIIFLCAQGASNVSGYCQAANRAHELSGKLNSHGGAGSSFATQPSFRHNPARTSSQILAQLYDSIYYWVWDTATAAWSTSSIEKDINFTYDIHQNKTGYTHQAWNGSSWDDQVQVQYGFDANNNPTSDLWLYWDGSAWENNFRINRTFNLNNKVAMVQNQSLYI